MYGPLSNPALWPLSDAVSFQLGHSGTSEPEQRTWELLITSSLGSTVLVTLWTREAL